jgi:hypothetical protein
MSPALLIACACGRLSGRTAFYCTLDREERRRALTMPAEDDERASISFINAVGFLAHFDHDEGKSTWPVPHLETVQQLAGFGLHNGVLHDEPEVGDLVVTWNRALNRYTRVSIVVSILGVKIVEGVERVRCRTLSGHRRGVFARPERFVPAHGDRFFRWVDLEQQSVLGTPLGRAA